MSLKDVEDALKKVRKSFAEKPRNEYERQVRRSNNTSLLKDARSVIENYSGDRVKSLLLELNSLEEMNANDQDKPTNDKEDPFAVDFSENDEEPEMATALTTSENKKKRKKKAGSEKKVSVKAPKEVDAPSRKELDTAAAAAAAATTEEKRQNTTSELVEMVRFDAATLKEIPDELLGRAPCRTIPDTALAVVEFDNKIEFESRSCTCRVEVYRSVLLALVLGEPLTDGHPAAAEMAVGGDIMDEDEEEPSDAGEEREGQEERADDDLKQLSNKLIAEYDAMQMAREEEEDKLSFPKEVNLAVQRKLRQLPSLSWTILMCHGGYFAGGVFVNSKCIMHKSFQRYVVRKKQGGKQSSNAKDGGGSYNSVGSQIRAGQEVKWRIDVSHILTNWKPLIEASNFVFYVAPGPQNLAVLTDFSSLPASAQTAKTAVSPVSVSDPRVRKVPLTTHRPNFEEVQRIFTELSQCHVSYWAQK